MDFANVDDCLIVARARFGDGALGRQVVGEAFQIRRTFDAPLRHSGNSRKEYGQICPAPRDISDRDLNCRLRRNRPEGDSRAAVGEVESVGNFATVVEPRIASDDGGVGGGRISGIGSKKNCRPRRIHG